MDQVEPAARPRRRRGCLVAAGVLVLLFGAGFYWIFGEPFDGWSRLDEIRVQRRCEATGAADSLCRCLIAHVKDDGLTPDEVGRGDLFRASIACGASGDR